MYLDCGFCKRVARETGVENFPVREKMEEPVPAPSPGAHPLPVRAPPQCAIFGGLIFLKF